MLFQGFNGMAVRNEQFYLHLNKTTKKNSFQIWVFRTIFCHVFGCFRFSCHQNVFFYILWDYLYKSFSMLRVFPFLCFIFFKNKDVKLCWKNCSEHLKLFVLPFKDIEDACEFPVVMYNWGASLPPTDHHTPSRPSMLLLRRRLSSLPTSQTVFS